MASNLTSSYVPSGGLDYYARTDSAPTLFPSGTPTPFSTSVPTAYSSGGGSASGRTYSGTSAASHAAPFSLGGVVNNAVSAVKSGIDSLTSPKQSVDYGYSSADPWLSYSASAPSSASLQELYPWTMVSPAYGADPKTAMQEALANTAVERQMQDFKRAGLNPVLAAKYGGADSNFNVGQVGVASGGASGAYVPSGDSGSSGAYVSSSAGKQTSGKSNFSMQMSTKSAVAALASAGTMAITKNFSLGAAAYYGTQSLLNAFVPTKRR